MRQPRSSKISLPNKTSLLLFSFFFILFVGFFIFIDDYFSVKNIKIISDGQSKGLTALEVLKKRNLLFLNLVESKYILYQSNPDLKAVELEKQYPDTLEIKVSFDQPAAALEVARGFFILSNTGRILYKLHENKTQLPIIHYYQELNYAQYSAGEEIGYKDIRTSLYFSEKARELALKVNTIDIKGLDMIALNLDKKKIIFTTEKKVNIQDYEFEVVIRQLKIQGKDFEVLDLRFEKPVVKF